MIARKTITVRRVIQVLRAAARSGVSIPELLDDAGISRNVLDDPDARIDQADFTRLLLRVMELTQDEFAGFGQARKSKPGTFSMMAHAVINCADLERAIQRGIRFYELFELEVRYRLGQEGDEAWLEVEASERLDFRDVIIESSLFLSQRFMSWLVGRPVLPLRVELDFDAGDEARTSFSGCAVLGGASRNRLYFDAEALSLPLVQNAISLSRFLKDSFAQLMDGHIDQAGLPAQIRAILTREGSNVFPDFTAVCQELEMTPQTLRRRLKEARTSYQAIKDAIRKDASVYYLSQPELSIDEIALLMGFSEASSFHRAFKKWTGVTPSVYRREHFGT